MDNTKHTDFLVELDNAEDKKNLLLTQLTEIRFGVYQGTKLVKLGSYKECTDFILK